jgi:hypothetical protein
MKQHEFDKVLNNPSSEGENPSYDYFDTFDENGIIVVGKNGKFGYITCKGERLTPLKYDKAMRIYWDVGKVCINGKWSLRRARFPIYMLSPDTVAYQVHNSIESESHSH